MNTSLKLFVCVISVVVFISCNNSNLGTFEDNTDVGDVNLAGSVEFNPSENSYTVSGSGENMWYEHDDFQFVWKQMSGDISLTADIDWETQGGEPYKKAVLIIRQSLEPGAAYVDAALHGNGLASMQFRDAPGDSTREVQSNVTSPERLRIEKRGDYISMSLAAAGGELGGASGAVKVPFSEPFYVGLGVCSHNPDTMETAIFSDVSLETIPSKPDSLMSVESTLEIIDIATLTRQVVYHTTDHIEAPNWTPDGETLIFNSDGLLYTIPVEGGDPEQIPTGFAEGINNDHGISPDGTMLAISDRTESNTSIIYTMPIEGGTPKRVTELGPSYWHGWSPDGETLTYCAARNGNYDVYTIPVDGGEETRLTTAEGLDDGPEYSPDGEYIYFNSVRTGTMQIWRMKPDGSEQEQITTDHLNDWFAHPSPDGKSIVYVTFGTDVPAGSHPPNKDVMLRMMNLETGEIQVLAKLFGGQGTINVPSWSPDSQRIAFVSYGLK